MRTRQALAVAACAALLYLGALAWADSRNAVFARLPEVAPLLPALALFSLASYAPRYLRWWWLLRRAGHATRLARGWLAYVAGFAFTATPGKVGELVRIRYLAAEGVPAATVLAAFVFERAFDLLALLALAALGLGDARLLAFLAGCVAALLAAIAFLARRPALPGRLVALLRRAGLRLAARWLRTLQQGLARTTHWWRPLDMAVALGLAILAWTITAAGFAWLLPRLGIELPPATALALYPAAMLAGAASMLPGGIGATEAAIVVLLGAAGVATGTAVLAAVAIRLGSLWFAVALGFGAVVVLERGMLREGAGQD